MLSVTWWRPPDGTTHCLFYVNFSLISFFAKLKPSSGSNRWEELRIATWAWRSKGTGKQQRASFCFFSVSRQRWIWSIAIWSTKRNIVNFYTVCNGTLQLFGWSNKRLWLMVHVLVSFVLKSELCFPQPSEEPRRRQLRKKVLLSTVEKQKRNRNVPFSFFLYPKYVELKQPSSAPLNDSTLMKVQESKKMERWWCS